MPFKKSSFSAKPNKDDTGEIVMNFANSRKYEDSVYLYNGQQITDHKYNTNKGFKFILKNGKETKFFSPYSRIKVTQKG